MIKRILVPIPGPSLGAAAVEHITSLARSHHARVTALIAADTSLEARAPALVAISDVVSRSMRMCAFGEEAQQAADELLAACRAADVPLEIDEQDADFVGAICRAWRYHDLVAFPMRGQFHPDVCPDPEAAMVRMIIGRVGPVVSIGEHPRPIRRVIIAYSGSHASAKSMKRFVQMGLWPDAAVRIVHVADDLPGEDRLLHDAADYCRAWGIEPETVQLHGVRATALIREAEAFDADLFVIGDSARSLLKRKVFGDVTLQVLRQPERAVFFAH